MKSFVSAVVILAVIAASSGSNACAQPLAYDTSAWELAPALPRDPAPWTLADVGRTLRERGAQQKARRELQCAGD